MASPQKEDGFTPIANEILEALACFQLSGHESRILYTLFRKTYGFRKKEDWISISQFCYYTGLNQPRVSEAVKSLCKKNILTKKRMGRVVILGLNKDYTTWKNIRKTYPYGKTYGSIRKNVIHIYGKALIQKKVLQKRKGGGEKKRKTDSLAIASRGDARSSFFDSDGYDLSSKQKYYLDDDGKLQPEK